MNFTDRPLASPGLISYRYKGKYGWVMIGATSDEAALKESKRSTGDMIAHPELLEVWDATRGSYVPIGATIDELRDVVNNATTEEAANSPEVCRARDELYRRLNGVTS